MYTDPHILQGKLPSEKSDIYSLGITCWQLLSREVPYEGYTLHTIIYKVSLSFQHVSYLITQFTPNLSHCQYVLWLCFLHINIYFI